MKFYYENHKGEKIDLSKYPYFFQGGDLLDWVFKYDNDGSRTRNYRKEPKEYKCKIAVVKNPFMQEDRFYALWHEAMDKLLNVLIVDVIENKTGKLYTDKGTYMPCKIVASSKGTWKTGAMINEITVLTDLNAWITEQKISISPISDMAASEDTGTKRYSYTYPYKYQALQTETSVHVDHYTESDFLLTIYGPTESVLININGYPYEVKYSLEAGEYMVIDSRPYVPKEERLYVVRTNGEKENIFNYRSVENSVFKKIPYGTVVIDYPRTYGIDLIIFKERSEPPWKS